MIFNLCAWVSLASGIDSLKGIMRSVYFPEKDLIVRTYADGVTISSPDQPLKEKKIIIKNWTFDEAFSFFYFDKDELYMVHQLNGSIFKVGEEGLELVEKMEYLKMFIETNPFIYDSTFYMYGGYGLWSARERLLKINESNRWEPVVLGKEVLNDTEVESPPGVYGNGAIISGNRLFIFNGRTVNVADPLENPSLADVWRFDFIQNTWSKLGKLNEEIFFELPESHATIDLGDRFLLLKKQKGLIELFPEENRMVLYQHTLASMDIMQSEFLRLPAFHRNGRIYFYRYYEPSKNEASEKRTYEFTSVPVKALYGAKVGEDVFYYEKWRFVKSPMLWLITGGALILGVFGFIYFRRSETKVEILDSGIRYRGTTYEMPAINLAVLKRLYDSEGPVSSQEIMEIVQNPNLQYSHNNRVKNDVIRQLNIQLQSILNTNEELITMTSSDADKRYKWYELKKERF